MNNGLPKAQALGSRTVEHGDASVADLGQLLVDLDAATLPLVYDRTAAVLYGAALRMMDNEEQACSILKTVYDMIQQPEHGYTPDQGRPLLWLLGHVHAVGCALVPRLCKEEATAPLYDGDFDHSVHLLMRCYAYAADGAEDASSDDPAMKRRAHLNNLSRLPR